MADKLFKKQLRDSLTDVELSLNGRYENTGIIAPNKELAGNSTVYSAGQGLALNGAEFSIAQNGATNNQVLRWNGTAWLPSTVSTTVTYYAYGAGIGAYVFASGNGITFNKVNGVGTFTIPLGVNLFSAAIHGGAADLNSNSFSIVFDGHFLNTSLATLFPPTVTKYDRLLEGTPSEALPYTYDIDNTPQIQITDVNPLRIRVINLNGIVNWGLKIQM